MLMTLMHLRIAVWYKPERLLEYIYFRQTIIHDNIARLEGLASLPSAHRKGDESRYNLWYTISKRHTKSFRSKERLHGEKFIT